MPNQLRERLRHLSPLFLVAIVLPNVLAILYFGFFASDVFISESRFIVRSPDKPAMSGIGMLFKSAGFSSAGDEIQAVRSYVESRDALRALNHGDAFAKAYSASSISIFDRFNPLGWSNAFEDLFQYYSGKVQTEHNSTSGIATLTVKAYTAADARRFNEQLLEMAEATVNTMNERARQDLVRVSEREVFEAKDRSQAAALALSTYRNRTGVIDPEKQATVQVQMISKLQDQLIASRTQLAQLRAVAPGNPQIEALDAQVRSLGGDIERELGKVAGSRGSLSSTTAQYQRLQLESQFSDRQLAAAMASLQEAQNEALRKHAYVERIVQPNLPDSPLEPHRIKGILAVFVASLIAYGIFKMLLASLFEHRE